MSKQNKTPNFSIQIIPGLGSRRGLRPNRTYKAHVWIKPVNGFKSEIALSCSNLPVGSSCSFSPAVVVPGKRSLLRPTGAVRSKLTIATGQSVPDCRFQIVATSGNLEKINDVPPKAAAYDARESAIQAVFLFAMCQSLYSCLNIATNLSAMLEDSVPTLNVVAVCLFAAMIIAANFALAFSFNKRKRWAARILLVWMPLYVADDWLVKLQRGWPLYFVWLPTFTLFALPEIWVMAWPKKPAPIATETNDQNEILLTNASAAPSQPVTSSDQLCDYTYAAWTCALPREHVGKHKLTQSGGASKQPE